MLFLGALKDHLSHEIDLVGQPRKPPSTRLRGIYEYHICIVRDRTLIEFVNGIINLLFGHKTGVSVTLNKKFNISFATFNIIFKEIQLF